MKGMAILTLMLLLAVTPTVVPFAGTAVVEAKQPKVNICHVSDEDLEYHHIRVAEKAWLHAHQYHAIVVNGVTYQDLLLKEGGTCPDIPEPTV